MSERQGQSLQRRGKPLTAWSGMRSANFVHSLQEKQEAGCVPFVCSVYARACICMCVHVYLRVSVCAHACVDVHV